MLFKAGFGKREVLCVNFQSSLVMFPFMQGQQLVTCSLNQEASRLNTSKICACKGTVQVYSSKANTHTHISDFYKLICTHTLSYIQCRTTLYIIIM